MDDIFSSHNVSGNGTESGGPMYLGFVYAAVSVVFFGSNFVPVKKMDAGDGMFFQWILCSAIWITGLCVHAIRHFPKFYPFAMLGGFLWATGNILVVPIIRTIGLSQGILIWGSFNMLAGWLSSRFGWFGMTARPPNNAALSYGGLSLCLVSTFIYILIKTNINPAEETEQPQTTGEDDDDALLPGRNEVSLNTDPATDVVIIEKSFLDQMTLLRRRIIGVVFSIISGVLYGLNFVPVIYLQDKDKSNSQNGLDYVFSHFCGIYLTSTVYLLIYCAVMKNKPQINNKIILPGFASGLMWAVADTAWFQSNAILSETISFPIITTGPGIVASLWGVFMFHEITGRRNLVILSIAFVFTISGGILTGFSKS